MRTSLQSNPPGIRARRSSVWVILASALLLFSTIACSEETDEMAPIDPIPPISRPGLLETLESEYNPLTSDPLGWSDSELAFLDGLGSKQIIGLGEGTHGTAEFFNAKFRIFRYLVENHGARVFGIEADFGESLILNDAIQRGATEEIAGLMRSTMLFWTWRTEEVQALLEWMSDYNVGKSNEEKLQYFGIDTQFNSFNPDLLQEYLAETNASFLPFANIVLQEAENASNTLFESYSAPEFTEYMEKLDDLQDSIQAHEAFLVNVSSDNAYRLNLHLARVVQQVSQVQYSNIKNNDFSINYRDEYMADNALWLRDYFDDTPVVLWAHNAHVSKNSIYLGAGGAMGRHLQQEMGSDYTNLAFLFARGTFTAVTNTGNVFGGIQTQSLDVAPQANSLNSILSRAEANVFDIDLSRLNKFEVWQEAFANSQQFFDIGALFNNNPQDYYRTFNPVHYDRIIYFERSTATVLLDPN